MKYVLLLVGDERVWAEASEAERQALYGLHEKFGRVLGERNAILGGEELDHSSTAKTVRNENGKSLVSDGPFSEVTEHLGGFYIVEAANMDEALAYAKMLPGNVEVRPVVEMMG